MSPHQDGRDVEVLAEHDEVARYDDYLAAATGAVCGAIVWLCAVGAAVAVVLHHDWEALLFMVMATVVGLIRRWCGPCQ